MQIQDVLIEFLFDLVQVAALLVGSALFLDPSVGVLLDLLVGLNHCNGVAFGLALSLDEHRNAMFLNGFLLLPFSLHVFLEAIRNLVYIGLMLR